MNSKLERYIVEALAFSGLVVCEHQTAYMLRRDIWATPLNAAQDFNDAKIGVEKFLRAQPLVKLFEIRLVGSENWLVVGTRSDDALTDRIRWILGVDVAGIRPYSPGRRLSEVGAGKRKPADEDPIPTWPCAERTERLAKAGLKDDQFEESSRFGSKRARM